MSKKETDMENLRANDFESTENSLAILDAVTFEEASVLLEQMESNTNWTDTTKHLMREATWSGC
ncbi:hypothetical protein [Mucilaginibacter sp. OK283]|jgi:hypothetical protein|uniref:hypothetical protein n=1 Tax=Mucilaginibacter sp. OK283 TaxID=1881049 RepID=UPI0008CB595B|nr:hypothetical protein [Mucilaginibacter sp. OK283]SEO68971.1 hypothetical protein SAMN05428947_103418 [Mucilaginibacter sp. OK283]